MAPWFQGQGFKKEMIYLNQASWLSGVIYLSFRECTCKNPANNLQFIRFIPQIVVGMFFFAFRRGPYSRSSKRTFTNNFQLPGRERPSYMFILQPPEGCRYQVQSETAGGNTKEFARLTFVKGPRGFVEVFAKLSYTYMHSFICSFINSFIYT